MIFKIMGKKGDAVYDYDIETGQIKFNELLSAGMLPMEVTPEGNKMVKEFRLDMEKVVWLPKIAGG